MNNKNKYYVKKNGSKLTRFIEYHGKPEATKISANWYLWLHYASDTVPNTVEEYRLPNLTGTKNAYYPDTHHYNHLMRQSDYRISSHYESWDPKNEK